MKRGTNSAEPARTRKVRQRRARVRASGPHHPRMSRRLVNDTQSEAARAVPSTASGNPFQEDENDFRSGIKTKFALLSVALVIVAWFLITGEEFGGWEAPPVSAWALNIAAATPLLALVRFRDPRAREATVTLGFEMQFLSGLYLYFAVVGMLSGVGTWWAEIPAAVFSSAVFVGIWYTNWRARARS